MTKDVKGVATSAGRRVRFIAEILTLVSPVRREGLQNVLERLVMDSSPTLAPRPQWRRLLRPLLLVAALVIVFGWLLPQFIDYQDVWEALGQLDGWELVVLLGLGLTRVLSEALMYRAPFLPGLGRGAELRRTSRRISQG